MGSLRNNEVLRCSSFSVTRFGMADSLARAVRGGLLSSELGMAVGLTLPCNGRISACELDTAF